MNDFQTINDVIQQSIKDSSYISVIISSCVFIIYIFINKLIDFFKSKDRNKPLIEMAIAIKDVSTNVVMLNNVLNKIIQENEKKEILKTKSVISLAFCAFKTNVAHNCIDIIVHNHLEENKEYIISNVKKLVNTEYYNIYSILSNYSINDCIISSKLKEEWIDEVVNNILMIMFNKQDCLARVSQLNNKLLLDINGYTTFIINKIFN